MNNVPQVLDDNRCCAGLSAKDEVEGWRKAEAQGEENCAKLLIFSAVPVEHRWACTALALT